jgi:hypothetical protein
MKKYFLFPPGYILLLIFASCTLPQGASGTVYPDSTGVYNTVSAYLTATGPATVKPSVSPLPQHPVITESPKPSPSPSPLPRTSTPVLDTPQNFATVTKVPIPCDLAAPGRPSVDISVPDGSRFQPGTAFSKTWRLVNAGACSWTKEYAIIWFSGELLGAVREIPFNSTIKPGQSVDISVDMVAPRQPGPHQSNWKLRNPGGVLFGIGPTGDAPFWVRIEVVEIATATTTIMPSPTITPTLGTVSKGSVELPVGNRFDLDTGKLSTGAGDDLALQAIDTASLRLVPVNGAKLANMGNQTPNDTDCRSAQLETAAVSIDTLNAGGFWCYRTSQGFPGTFKVNAVNAKDGKISFDYLTWAIP